MSDPVTVTTQLPMHRAVPFRNSVGLDLLPTDVPYIARFRMAAHAGFAGVEMEVVASPDEAAEVHAAALSAGLTIHSVLAPENWRFPLSSADPAEVRRCLAALYTALGNAKRWGADTLLLIPAVVNASTSYLDAYKRSQAVIRGELIPAAQEHGVLLGIENVWNGFLLGPLEYVRYIDELESPWVRAYLDVGNMFLSRPEDWIRVAGRRVVKLHMKDLHVDLVHGRFRFGRIGDGDVDWQAVRRALIDIGFAGFITSTGVPRRRISRTLAGWQRRLRSSDRASLVRALAAVKRRADERFLHDVAQRFVRFRDGQPFAASGS